MCGTEFLRYGGNTTSIELVSNAGARLLVDLGTGATEYGKQLMGCEFSRGEGRLPVLLSHTHLDHIQGLPFFTPFFIKGNQIRILGADPAGSSLTQTLQNQLAPHYSPLNGLENLAAGVSIEAFVPGGELRVDGFEVSTAAVPHGNMWTTGFRIKADDKIVTILSDVEYPEPDRPTPEAFRLAAGADLLVHDATFLEEPDRRYPIHATTAEAIEVGRIANVKTLILYHLSIRYDRQTALPALRAQVAASGFAGDCWLLDEGALLPLR